MKEQLKMMEDAMKMMKNVMKMTKGKLSCYIQVVNKTVIFTKKNTKINNSASMLFKCVY
jgi:DNA-binding XRE family transcriptional regulator